MTPFPSVSRRASLTLRWSSIVALVTAFVGGMASCAQRPVTSVASLLRLATDESNTSLANALANGYEDGHPYTTIMVAAHERAALVGMIVRGEADAAIALGDYGSEGLFNTRIGQSEFTIVTAPNNPISAIDLASLRRVFQGTIVNWAQIGGSDSHITPVAWARGTSERIAFDTLLLMDDQVASNARVAANMEQVIVLVSGAPGSVGYLIHAANLETLNQIRIVDAPGATALEGLNDHRLIAPVNFIAEHEPKGKAKEFLDWILSAQGQLIVSQHAASLDQ